MPTLRTTRTLTITSPVPPTITPQTLVATLHNHPFLLNIQPITTSYTPLPSSSPLIPTPEEEPFARESDADWYQVHESVPLVGDITFIAAFRDMKKGCECVVRAPMGLRMGVVYSVEDETADGGREAGQTGNSRQGDGERVLKEVCTIEANALLIPFITFNFESVHKRMQKEMVEKLEKGEMPRDKRAPDAG